MIWPPALAEFRVLECAQCGLTVRGPRFYSTFRLSGSTVNNIGSLSRVDLIESQGTKSGPFRAGMRRLQRHGCELEVECRRRPGYTRHVQPTS